jgi:transposase-like protein
MLRVVEKSSEENPDLRMSLDELLRRGTLHMLHQALKTEVEEYLTRHRGERDAQGRAQVVRNGKAPARQLVTGTGTVHVRAPRINDRRVDADGQRQRFTSEILPSYMRRAPKVTEVLPILNLRGLSTGDFQAALPVLLGEDAAGLSPTTITRLTASWEAEYHAWRTRSLADSDYVARPNGNHLRSVRRHLRGVVQQGA